MTRLLLALAATLAVAVPAAVAAKKNGITPTSPKAGATVDVGSRPTFKGKVSGAGSVWIYVAESKKRDGDGLIKSEHVIQQAKKKKGRFSAKAKFFDHPTFWLNTPGTYYWQAHRISCEGNTSDCKQEGPIVKFKVG